MCAFVRVYGVYVNAQIFVNARFEKDIIWSTFRNVIEYTEKEYHVW